MKNWRLWISIVSSLFCLYLAVRDVEFRNLLEILRDTNRTLLLPAFAILTLGLLVRALRWRFLLHSLSGPTIGRLFNVLSIGYLFNNIFPLRLGDLFRAYLFAELEHISAVRVLSTVVVERVADTATVVSLLFLLVPFISLPSAPVRTALSIGLAAMALILLLALIASSKERNLAIVNGLAARLGLLNQGGFERAITSAVDGLMVLDSWRSALGLGSVSLMIWLSAALQFYVIMQAIGLNLPFAAALATLCFTSLGMVVPSSPGYIGVFEYSTIASLSLFNVSKEAALSCALVLHAFSYLSIAALGAAAIWIEGYSQARLNKVLTRIRLKKLE